MVGRHTYMHGSMFVGWAEGCVKVQDCILICKETKALENIFIFSVFFSFNLLTLHFEKARRRRRETFVTQIVHMQLLSFTKIPRCAALNVKKKRNTTTDFYCGTYVF